MAKMHIMYDDLNERAKEELKEIFGFKKDFNAIDNNWDIIPLATLEIEDDENHPDCFN